MSSSEFNNPKLEILITTERLQERIREMGAEIARDYYTRLLALSADADTDRPELRQARDFLARS